MLIGKCKHGCDHVCFLNQESVFQTTAWMTSRSRSSFWKMLLRSSCPVRSHHWSVSHIQITQGLSCFYMFYVNLNQCVHVLKVKDCLDHSALPMDGATLTEALHQRGINVRYLGSVLEFVDKTPAKAQLEHFYVSVNQAVTLTSLLPVHYHTYICCCVFPPTSENRNQWADYQVCKTYFQDVPPGW